MAINTLHLPGKLGGFKLFGHRRSRLRNNVEPFLRRTARRPRKKVGRSRPGWWCNSAEHDGLKRRAGANLGCGVAVRVSSIVLVSSASRSTLGCIRGRLPPARTNATIFAPKDRRELAREPVNSVCKDTIAKESH